MTTEVFNLKGSSSKNLSTYTDSLFGASYNGTNTETTQDVIYTVPEGKRVKLIMRLSGMSNSDANSFNVYALSSKSDPNGVLRSISRTRLYIGQTSIMEAYANATSTINESTRRGVLPLPAYPNYGVTDDSKNQVITLSSLVLGSDSLHSSIEAIPLTYYLNEGEQVYIEYYHSLYSSAGSRRNLDTQKSCSYDFDIIEEDAV